MRISDWSSDVCSSDLHLHEGMSWLTLILELQDRDPQPFLVDLRRVARVRSRHPPPDIGVMADDDTEADPSRLDEDRIEHEDVRKEIGRASSRERVCQYV